MSPGAGGDGVPPSDRLDSTGSTGSVIGDVSSGVALMGIRIGTGIGRGRKNGRGRMTVAGGRRGRRGGGGGRRGGGNSRGGWSRKRKDLRRGLRSKCGSTSRSDFT